MRVFICCCGFLALALVVSLNLYFFLQRKPVAAQQPNAGVVHTRAGPVRGYLSQTHFLHHDHYAYRGIPYARPPVGELRWREPQPTPDGYWSATGIRDGRADGPMCMQEIGPPTKRMIVGSEDCLTLNVYAPPHSDAPTAQRLRPVLVFVHGGAFYRRTGAPHDLFGADPLVEAGLVVVTFNHRLGVLGFLATDANANANGTAVLAGNWGLLDQRLALRWVRHNIGAFGGDAERVTFAGQSAGALAVQMHRRASRSRGLFARTIELSTAFDGRAVFRPPRRDIALELRRLVGLPAHADDALVVTALRHLPAETLVRAFPFVQFETAIMPRADRFCDLHASNALPADVLTGCTSNEAISQASPTGGLFEQFQRDHRIHIPSERFNEDYESAVYVAAQERIAALYFRAGIRNATLAEFVRLQSDVYQTVPLDRKVRALAQHQLDGKTYQYEFGLETRLNGWKRWHIDGQTAEQLEGAAHTDELCYMFHCAAVWPQMYDGLTSASPEYAHIVRFTRTIATFVRGEKLEWAAVQRASKDVLGFMRMRTHDWTEVRRPGGVLGERLQSFWDGVLSEFGEENP